VNQPAPHVTALAPGSAARRRTLASCASAVVAAVGCSTAEEPSRGRSPACAGLRQDHGVWACTLDSGLGVLISPDQSQAKIALAVTYRAGTADEPVDAPELAHVLEHMLFQGSAHFGPTQRELQVYGASTNAVTSRDSTQYVAQLPAGEAALSHALAIEADRMTSASLPAASLARVLSVVENELSLDSEDAAAVAGVADLHRLTFGAAFAVHGYGRSLREPPKRLAHIDRPALEAFYRRHYRPDNASVAIAGPIEVSSALALIERSFGAVPRPMPATADQATREPRQEGERSVTLVRATDTRAVAVVFRTVAAIHPDYPALEGLRAVLTDGDQSRLHQALVAPGLARQVAADASPYRDPGVFSVVAEAAAKQPSQALRETLLAELDLLASGRRPVTDAEIDRVQRSAAPRPFPADMDVTRRVMQLGNSAALGDWRIEYAVGPAVASLGADELNRVARAYLKRSNRTVGTLEPVDQPDLAPPQAVSSSLPGWLVLPARATTAPETTDFVYSFDSIEAHAEYGATRGGFKLGTLVMPSRENAVAMLVTLEVSSLRELRGRHAALSLLPEVLARRTESAGDPSTTIRFDARANHLVAWITTPGDRAPAVLERVARALTPELTRSEVAGALERRLAAVRQSAAVPAEVASRASFAMLDAGLPPEDVRVRRSLATELADLQRVRFDAVRDLHRALITAKSGQAMIVGRFAPAALRKATLALFDGWRGLSTESVPLQFSPTPAARERFELPGGGAAVVQLGSAVRIRADDPDYPGLLLAGEVLGGFPESRLSRRLREREGLAYETYAQLHVRDEGDAGWLVVGATVATELAVASLRDELERLVRDPVTDEEVVAAKARLAMFRDTYLHDISAVCEMLSTAMASGRTRAVEGRKHARLQALTTEDVNAAIRRHLRLGSVVQVIAGGPRSP
jgi:zinc protease